MTHTHTQVILNISQIVCSVANVCVYVCVFAAGVRRPPAQPSGADGQNPHQEQEIPQTLKQHRHQETDGPTCQSEQRSSVS